MGVTAPFGGAYAALAQLGEASRPLAVGVIDSTGLGPPSQAPNSPRSQCRGFSLCCGLSAGSANNLPDVAIGLMRYADFCRYCSAKPTMGQAPALPSV
jgi:hypothetical protein